MKIMNQPSYLEPISQAYQDRFQRAKREAMQPKIKVNQALSSLALIYEKIRTAVDFRAEHLFRRVAIERILRRYLLTGRRNTERLAYELIKELIWSRYLKNESVPVKKVARLSRIITKYCLLKDKVLGRKNGVFDQQAELLLGLMATEIDELLVDQSQDEAWIWGLSKNFSSLPDQFIWLNSTNQSPPRTFLKRPNFTPRPIIIPAVPKRKLSSLCDQPLWEVKTLYRRDTKRPICLRQCMEGRTFTLL